MPHRRGFLNAILGMFALPIWYRQRNAVPKPKPIPMPERDPEPFGDDDVDIGRQRIDPDPLAIHFVYDGTNWVQVSPGIRVTPLPFNHGEMQ